MVVPCQVVAFFEEVEGVEAETLGGALLKVEGEVEAAV